MSCFSTCSHVFLSRVEWNFLGGDGGTRYLHLYLIPCKTHTLLMFTHTVQARRCVLPRRFTKPKGDVEKVVVASPVFFFFCFFWCVYYIHSLFDPSSSQMLFFTVYYAMLVGAGSPDSFTHTLQSRRERKGAFHMGRKRGVQYC